MVIIKKRLLPIFLILFVLFNTFTPTTSGAAKSFPDEVEITLRISSTQNYASSGSYQSDNYYRDSSKHQETENFSISLEGTARYEGDFFESSGYYEDEEYVCLELLDADYKATCGGGGSYSSEDLYTLERGSIGEATEVRKFSSTTHENWNYSFDSVNPIEDEVFIADVHVYAAKKKGEAPSYVLNFDDSFDVLLGKVRHQGTSISTTGGFDGTDTLSSDSERSGPTVQNVSGAYWELMGEGIESEFVRGQFTLENGKFVASKQISHDYFISEDEFGTINISYEINRKPQIKEIQVNQGLGRYEYVDEDDYQPATDFVAGKDTVIQVFLAGDSKIKRIKDLTLDIYRDGNKITTLKEYKEDVENNVAIFIPPSRAACGDWQAGKYKFEAKIKGTKFTLNDITLKKRRDLNILAVPVKANYGGMIVAVRDHWKQSDNFLRKVFPLSDKNVKWKLGKMLDASADKYDLSTNEGCYALWKKLNSLQASNGTKYDVIIGFVENVITFKNGTRATGFTYPGGKATVVANTVFMAKTVAHETAHLFYIGDEYNGGSFNLGVNNPPFGYKGVSLLNSKLKVTAEDKAIKAGPAGSGSLVKKQFHPFEIGRRNLMKDLDSFMGSALAADKSWITPSIWKSLYKSFDPKTKGASGSSSSGSGSNEQAETVVMEVAGKITKTGEIEFIMPWRSYITTEVIEQNVGEYEIQAVDASGRIIAQQGFSATTLLLTDPPQIQDDAVFVNVQIPLLSGTNKFQVVEGENLLGEIQVSPGIPSVEIISSPVGTLSSGTIPLEWTANDPDGDKLYYTVEYSNDGITWIVLESELTDTKLSIDVGELPGGEQSRIRIIASDGINSAFTESATFNVPYQAPEIFLDDPLIQKDGVALNGRAYDLADGWIYNEKLSWTSDKDGEIGKGSTLFLTNLTKGKHTVTLRVVNEHNQQAEKSFEIDTRKNTSGPRLPIPDIVLYAFIGVIVIAAILLIRVLLRE